MTKTNKPYDYAIFIGRFQIFHEGHKKVLDFALEQCERVIVIAGSANVPRTFKNPFTSNERLVMISAVYSDLLKVRPYSLHLKHVNDYAKDNAWLTAVQNIVDETIESDGKDPDSVKIAIVGNKKDHTSYYIDMFPQWDFIEPPVTSIMNASDIRDILFGEDIKRSTTLIRPLVPHNILMYLENFKTTIEFTNLAQEWAYIRDYKKSWEKAPYEPIFVTVDSIIVQSGHVLLIKRRSEPGKGLWALPGGFLNPKERILDAMIRELREETKIKVAEPVLRGSIVGSHVFDDPDRSLRGRTITHAFHIDLGIGPLPRVKGADDALKAKWTPFNEICSNIIFEDHHKILQHFLGNAIK